MSSASGAGTAACGTVLTRPKRAPASTSPQRSSDACRRQAHPLPLELAAVQLFALRVEEARLVRPVVGAHAVADPGDEDPVAAQRQLRERLGVARGEQQLELLAEAQRVLVAQANRGAGLFPLAVAEADRGAVRGRILRPQHDADAVRRRLELHPAALDQPGRLDLVEGAQAALHVEAGSDRDVEGAAQQALRGPFVAARHDFCDARARQHAVGIGPRAPRQVRDGRRGELLADERHARPGGLVAGLDQRVELLVVAGRVLPEVGTDVDIRLGLEVLVAPPAQQVAHLRRDSERVRVLVRLHLGAADVDRDRDGRAEHLRDVRRQVVDDQAVHEPAPFPLHGLEEDGDRHARPHRARQVALRQDHAVAVAEVGRHRPKRDRQPVEVAADRVGRRREVPDQEAVHAVIGHQARRQPGVLPVEVDADPVGVVVVPAHDRQRAPVGAAAEEPRPVERAHDLLELGGRAPRGVDAAHHRAHAVGRDRVDRQPGLLERAQRPDVGDAAGTSSGEREREPWARRSHGGLLRLGGRPRPRAAPDRQNDRWPLSHLPFPRGQSVPGLCREAGGPRRC